MLEYLILLPIFAECLTANEFHINDVVKFHENGLNYMNLTNEFKIDISNLNNKSVMAVNVYCQRLKILNSFMEELHVYKPQPFYFVGKNLTQYREEDHTEFHKENNKKMGVCLLMTF